MFIKAAARSMPLGLILLVMGSIGVLWFTSRSRAVGEATFPQAFRSRTMVVRSGFELTGRLFYALAIALIPLSTTSAILQATPLVVVMGAAVLFGEKVGAWRWTLTIFGFLGVLLILRPGLAGFDALSLLAVLGLLGFAGRDLATRAAPPVLSNAQLGTAGFAVLGVSGLVLLLRSGLEPWPTPLALAMTLGASLFGITGYAFLTRAMRTGDVSAVTPFRYTRLLFAMVLGMTVFGERPDLMTLNGSAMVVVCGALVLTSARRK
jgi:drug/metabolite transporter (DMT)-like permease